MPAISLADDLSITLTDAAQTPHPPVARHQPARVLLLAPDGRTEIREIPAGLVIDEFYRVSGDRLVRHLFDPGTEASPLRSSLFLAWGGGSPNRSATRLTRMGRAVGSEVGGTALIVRYVGGVVGDLDDAELLWLTALAGGFDAPRAA